MYRRYAIASFAWSVKCCTSPVSSKYAPVIVIRTRHISAARFGSLMAQPIYRLTKAGTVHSDRVGRRWVDGCVSWRLLGEGMSLAEDNVPEVDCLQTGAASR